MIDRVEDIAAKMVASGRGILAADESTGTIRKRFESIGLDSTADKRRDYREILFSTTDAMNDYVSGVILFDETIRQDAANGKSLVRMLNDTDSLPGIKVDAGALPHDGFDNEKLTSGLDGLGERLKEYYELGARFAKWRGVIAIDDLLPTQGNVKANAQALAQYSVECQKANIVPIVEPEVTMDGEPGTHSIERCHEVTENVLNIVFDELAKASVNLEGIVLKPNMVIDGKNARKASVDEVAERTVAVLKSVVPNAVPGVAFLSGGQTDLEATTHLNAMNAAYDTPFALTFSYGRALQAPSLQAWGGKAENADAARAAFAHRANMNHLAALGQWNEGLEGLEV